MSRLRQPRCMNGPSMPRPRVNSIVIDLKKITPAKKMPMPRSDLLSVPGSDAAVDRRW